MTREEKKKRERRKEEKEKKKEEKEKRKKEAKMEMLLGWVVLGVLVVAMAVLSVGFVFLYSRRGRVVVVNGEDTEEEENNQSSGFLPLFVSGITLFVVFCCACLIPVDIYSVSSSVDPHTGQRTITEDQLENRQKAIETSYEVLYSFVLILTVVVIPFSHFYYEETGETFSVRAMAASKYAGIMFAILFISFIIGFLVGGSVPEFNVSDTDSAGANLQSYVQNLIDSTSWPQQGLDFTMTLFTLLGFSIYGTYTAYGLSSLPVSLLKGTRHIDEERTEVQEDLENIRNKKRELQVGMKGLSMTVEDVDELGEIEDRERALARHSEALEGNQNSCCLYLRPFFVLFGGLFAIFSIFLVTCIIATTFARLSQQEDCGFACDFVVTVDFVNPLDQGLLFASRFFPLDIILLGIVIGYMIGVTMFAISSAGIKIFILSLYRVAVRATCPQGMLWLVLYLSLAITALNFEMMFLAPQYTTWGSQTYVSNGKVIPCSMLGGDQGNDGHQDNNVCTMSMVATMYNSVQLRLSFISFIFTLANCLFVVVWLCGLIISLCKKQKANYEEDPNDHNDLIGDDDL